MSASNSRSNINLIKLKVNPNEIGLLYHADIPYEDFGKKLVLQIIQPTIFSDPDRKYPAIVYVQGSGWRKQNLYKNVVALGKLAEKGYVIAVVQYRDTDAGFHFPAPIVDTKNAIRFLKKNADDYKIKKNDFFLMGGSSGGQIATIAGMTARTNYFDHPINKEKAWVKGIIDLYGAVNLTMKNGILPGRTMKDPSPQATELGFNPESNLKEAEKANAQTYLKEDYPPILIAHGTADKIVSVQQSIDFYSILKENHKQAYLYLLIGADHANNAFYDERMSSIYDHFIKKCLS